jgi:hypothetical protein
MVEGSEAFAATSGPRQGTLLCARGVPGGLKAVWVIKCSPGGGSRLQPREASWLALLLAALREKASLSLSRPTRSVCLDGDSEGEPGSTAVAMEGQPLPLLLGPRLAAVTVDRAVVGLGVVGLNGR